LLIKRIGADENSK
jgi:hypothetical protein